MWEYHSFLIFQTCILTSKMKQEDQMIRWKLDGKKNTSRREDIDEEDHRSEDWQEDQKKNLL
jgi:hypothetical protein